MKEGRVLLVRLVEWGTTQFIEKCQNKGRGRQRWASSTSEATLDAF